MTRVPRFSIRSRPRPLFRGRHGRSGAPVSTPWRPSRRAAGCGWYGLGRNDFRLDLWNGKSFSIAISGVDLGESSAIRVADWRLGQGVSGAEENQRLDRESPWGSHLQISVRRKGTPDAAPSPGSSRPVPAASGWGSASGIREFDGQDIHGDFATHLEDGSPMVRGADGAVWVALVWRPSPVQGLLLWLGPRHRGRTARLPASTSSSTATGVGLGGARRHGLRVQETEGRSGTLPGRSAQGRAGSGRSLSAGRRCSSFSEADPLGTSRGRPGLLSPMPRHPRHGARSRREAACPVPHSVTAPLPPSRGAVECGFRRVIDPQRATLDFRVQLPWFVVATPAVVGLALLALVGPWPSSVVRRLAHPIRRRSDGSRDATARPPSTTNADTRGLRQSEQAPAPVIDAVTRARGLGRVSTGGLPWRESRLRAGARPTASPKRFIGFWERHDFLAVTRRPRLSAPPRQGP
jgi:hypothetical protein